MERIVNPIFCDEIFGVIRTLNLLPPCWCTEVVRYDDNCKPRIPVYMQI